MLACPFFVYEVLYRIWQKGYVALKDGWQMHVVPLTLLHAASVTAEFYLSASVSVGQWSVVCGNKYVVRANAMSKK